VGGFGDRTFSQDLFDAVPAGIELSALQRAQARALLEVLLAEAISESRRAESAREQEVDHDENNC
jgi:hypothetical protein